MATPAFTEDHTVECDCMHGLQVEKAANFYDINNPPDALDQLASFPDRAEGQDNLVWVLMKMEGRTGHLPIVFCIDCAAEKYVQYCDSGAWVYQYKPCAIDKDFYCPKFYAELMRRIWTDHANAGVWGQLLPTVSRKPLHANGCLHSSTPDFIIQPKEGLTDSIYFRHCGGEFRNLKMQTLEMESKEDATMPDIGNRFRQAKNIGPHTVPGLEWKDTTRVQSTIFVDGVTHL